MSYEEPKSEHHLTSICFLLYIENMCSTVLTVYTEHFIRWAACAVDCLVFLSASLAPQTLCLMNGAPFSLLCYMLIPFPLPACLPACCFFHFGSELMRYSSGLRHALCAPGIRGFGVKKHNIKLREEAEGRRQGERVMTAARPPARSLEPQWGCFSIFDRPLLLLRAQILICIT